MEIELIRYSFREHTQFHIYYWNSDLNRVRNLPIFIRNGIHHATERNRHICPGNVVKQLPSYMILLIVGEKRCNVQRPIILVHVCINNNVPNCARVKCFDRDVFPEILNSFSPLFWFRKIIPNSDRRKRWSPVPWKGRLHFPQEIHVAFASIHVRHTLRRNEVRMAIG